MVVFSLSIALSFWRLELYLILDFRCTCLLCFMFYVLCFMFYVLCFMFYVLCFMFYVLCFMFFSFTSLLIYLSTSLRSSPPGKEKATLGLGGSLVVSVYFFPTR